MQILYNVGKDSLLWGCLRNVAIYLTMRLRADTLKEAGKVFGIEKNSSVGSVVET